MSGGAVRRRQGRLRCQLTMHSVRSLQRIGGGALSCTAGELQGSIADTEEVNLGDLIMTIW